jgi:hypothetical protein
MVRRISGKHCRAAIAHLKVNGTTIYEPQDIANTIASTISHNSSSNHYTDKFRCFKTRQEKHAVRFQSNSTDDYNLPFTMTELKEA